MGTWIQITILFVATDLEEASKKGQQREVWDKIKKISGKKKKKVGMSVEDLTIFLVLMDLSMVEVLLLAN